MGSFLVSGLNQIYDRVSNVFSDPVEAKKVTPAHPAPVTLTPDPEPAQPAQDDNQVKAKAPEAFTPQAASFPTPKPAAQASAAVVTPLKASAPAPSMDAINQRFARTMEAAKRNPGLMKSPELMQKVLQDLRDQHIGELAMASAETGKTAVLVDLESYQSTVKSVRSGGMLARNPSMLPAKATPDQKAAVKGQLEEMLYEDLVAGMQEKAAATGH